MASYLAAPSTENPLRSSPPNPSPNSETWRKSPVVLEGKKILAPDIFKDQDFHITKALVVVISEPMMAYRRLKGAIRTPKQLTITSNTRKSSEVTDSRKERSFCQAKKSLM